MPATIELLEKIYSKLEEIDLKIDNFIGFFEMSEEDVKSLEEDIKDAREGKTLEELTSELL